MTMTLRERILAVEDHEQETQYIPEWGFPVTVRTMSGAERESWERRMETAREEGTVRATTAAIVCRDEEGNRLFTDADIPTLNRKSSAALNRIFEMHMELSAISREDVEKIEGE